MPQDRDFEKAIDIVTQWIINYRIKVADFPVLSRSKPGETLDALPEHAPETSESFENVFADFEKLIIPGITHWQHPKFFGYFPSNASPPSVLAEMLIAALGVQCMSWATSPAATELEIRVVEWLRDLLGIPSVFTGVIQESASNSVLAAMVAAREKATQFTVNENGYGDFKLTAYCSAEAHSSIEKAAKVIGIGRNFLRKIPVDHDQRMRVDLLEKAIEEDIQNGLTPFFVVGAFGTTGTTAVDDLAAIANVVSKHGLWFHVDAAYAGAALVLPEIRARAQGIEKADSIVVNPHKWLLTNFDCSVFLVRDRAILIQAFEILPEYLKTSEDEVVTNLRDWGLGLGRRFRALKLWFVLRWYGASGIQKMIRHHISLARQLETWISENAAFELVARQPFNLVVFRLRKDDQANLELMRSLNESGKLFLTHTKLDGGIVLRLVIGQTDVQKHHVLEAWNEIQKAAANNWIK